MARSCHVFLPKEPSPLRSLVCKWSELVDLDADLANPEPKGKPRPRSARPHPHRVDRPAPAGSNYINSLRSKEGKVRPKVVGNLVLQAPQGLKDRYGNYC